MNAEKRPRNCGCWFPALTRFVVAAAKFSMGTARLVEQLELEPAKRAETADGRRQEWHDDGTTDATECAAEAADHGLRGLRGVESLLEGLSRMNRSPRLGEAPLKLKPPTVNALAMSFSLASTASTWRATLLVYSSDVPSGA